MDIDFYKFLDTCKMSEKCLYSSGKVDQTRQKTDVSQKHHTTFHTTLESTTFHRTPTPHHTINQAGNSFS